MLSNNETSSNKLSVLHVHNQRVSVLPEQKFLPDAYRLPERSVRKATIEGGPKVVFIEVTNR